MSQKVPLQLIFVHSRYDVFHRRFVGIGSNLRCISEHFNLVVRFEDTEFSHYRIEKILVERESEIESITSPDKLSETMHSLLYSDEVWRQERVSTVRVLGFL